MWNNAPLNSISELKARKETACHFSAAEMLFVYAKMLFLGCYLISSLKKATVMIFTKVSKGQ